MALHVKCKKCNKDTNTGIGIPIATISSFTGNTIQCQHCGSKEVYEQADLFET